MIELAGPETARYVADNLSDREVGVRMFGREDAAALCYETARDSIISCVVRTPDGEPVCLFGADGDAGDDWGSAWMFSTPNVGRAKIELVKKVTATMAYSRNHWPQLRIVAEDRDDRQKRFLAFMGFRPVAEGETELVY